MTPVTSYAELVRMSLANVLLGLGYLLGWQSSERMSITSRYPHLIRTIDHSNSAKLLCVAGSIFGTLSLLVLVSRAGGIMPFIHLEVSLIDLVGTNYFNVITLLTAQFVAAIVGLGWLRQKHVDNKVINAALCMVVLLYLMASIRIGTRMRVMYGLVALIVANGWFTTRRKAIVWFLVGVFMLPVGLLFGQVRTDRTPYYQQILTICKPGEYKTTVVGQSLIRRDEFDCFENGAQLISVVDKSGSFLYGTSFLAGIINPIPRFIWPNKPVIDISKPARDKGIGKTAVENANFAFSLGAEAFVNFYWVGPVIVGYALAYLSNAIWRKSIPVNVSPQKIMILTALAVFSATVLRGSFTIMFTMCVLHLPLPLLSFLNNRIIIKRAVKKSFHRTGNRGVIRPLSQFSV